MDTIAERYNQQPQPMIGGSGKLMSICATSEAAKEKINESKKHAVALTAADFHFANHFYPKVQRAHCAGLGKRFFALTNAAVAQRYCELNPDVDRLVLDECLAYQPKYFRWAGCDLFNVTDGNGKRQMIIIETNSCPSGSF